VNAAMLSLLYGLRPAVGCIEIDVAAVKVRFVVGPQLLHGSQLLVVQFSVAWAESNPLLPNTFASTSERMPSSVMTVAIPSFTSCPRSR
jgi:hypothetical protein